jgi:hypothetical protein
MFTAAVCNVILREIRNTTIYLRQAREFLGSLTLRFRPQVR